MKTITLCTQKGGAGKTTVSVLIAMAVANAGRRVGVVDYDPQQSASSWISGLAPSHENLELYRDGESYDFIINDTPPKLDRDLELILKKTDLAVIVTSPSPVEVMSAKTSVRFVAENIKDGGHQMLLFNKVDRRTMFGKNLDDIGGMISDIRPNKAYLPACTAYQRAALEGWSALRRKESECIVKVALEIMTSI